ncbi:MAG: hypothetical protein KGL63_06585 [Betaproteobacteria bacterium]|nr:hypothetical protein [Betaproteobacteria bacterium]
MLDFLPDILKRLRSLEDKVERLLGLLPDEPAATPAPEPAAPVEAPSAPEEIKQP